MVSTAKEGLFEKQSTMVLRLPLGQVRPRQPVAKIIYASSLRSHDRLQMHDIVSTTLNEAGESVTLGDAIEECFKSLKGSGVASEAINLLWEDKPTGTGPGNIKNMPNTEAEIPVNEDETPEQKLARLEAENAALRQLVGNVADDADFGGEAEPVAEFVDDTSARQFREPMEVTGGLLNIVLWSENYAYRLTQPIEEHPPLREFSPDEYAAFKNAGWVKFFTDERVFHGPDIEFADRKWTLVVGTTNGRIYKLSPQYVCATERDFAQTWDRSKQILKDKLGPMSEQYQNPIRLIWNLRDGNAILECVRFGGKTVINLFLTANTRK